MRSRRAGARPVRWTRLWHGNSCAHRQDSFAILGAVILALTGAEALYADIGHFGTRAIRRAWRVSGDHHRVLRTSRVDPISAGLGEATVLLPGAFLGAHTAVLLALLATVIASQAVISGAFSMTSQAIDLGFLPRLRAVETSASQRGQVYVPDVNALLFAAVLLLVLTYRSSERLTSAYGIAVGLTMLVTTVQMVSLSRNVWRWPWLAIAAASGPLFVIDAVLVAANVHKVPQGGWFPVAMGVVLFVLMATRRRGLELAERHASHAEPLADFLRDTLQSAEPPALTSDMRHNRVLHRTVVVFANRSESAPRVDELARIEVRDLGANCFEVISRHGFVERPSLPRLLASLDGRLGDWHFDPKLTTFFLPRDEALPGCSHGQMARWRERFFSEMLFHSASSAEYYGLRSEDVVELGVQVSL